MIHLSDSGDKTIRAPLVIFAACLDLENIFVTDNLVAILQNATHIESMHDMNLSKKVHIE